MARDRSEKDEKDGGGLRAWARDGLVAIVIVVALFGSIFAYTQVWPPLVVVESSSMQHGNDVSSIGVIDTGDLVLVQAAPTRDSVITWIQGRVSGHSTYGDYGDVIVFHKAGTAPDSTPIIHRAIMYVIPNGTGAYDVPDLAPPFPSTQWEGWNRDGAPVTRPYGLSRVTIHEMGFPRTFTISFDLEALADQRTTLGEAGYITMGDNNAYNACRWNPDPCGAEPYEGVIAPQSNLVGKARGEIPWFGLIKLTLAPTPSCCNGWGDPAAPKNSWDSLVVALAVLIALPFLVEGAGWAWAKYVTPRLRARRSPDLESTDNPGSPR